MTGLVIHVDSARVSVHRTVSVTILRGSTLTATAVARERYKAISLRKEATEVASRLPVPAAYMQ